MSTNTAAQRAVIWDLDGTLIDSGDAHWTSWRDVFAAEGVADVDEDLFATWFGRRSEEVLREHLGPGATAAEIARIDGIKEAHYRESLVRAGVVLLPGAEDWLNYLAGEGGCWGSVPPPRSRISGSFSITPVSPCTSTPSLPGKMSAAANRIPRYSSRPRSALVSRHRRRSWSRMPPRISWRRRWVDFGRWVLGRVTQRSGDSVCTDAGGPRG